MNWSETLQNLILTIVPIIVMFLINRYLKTEEERKKFHDRISAGYQFAKEAILFVEDAFPDMKGLDKLKKAMDYFKQVMANAGYPVTNEEAEAKVRSAFQTSFLKHDDLIEGDDSN